MLIIETSPIPLYNKKEQVYQWVNRYVDPASPVGGLLINEMRGTRFKDGFECSHCNSEHVVRFGKYNGRQRYRCKSCSEIFTDTTNTVLFRTRKCGGNSKHRRISHEQVLIKYNKLRKINSKCN